MRSRLIAAAGRWWLATLAAGLSFAPAATAGPSFRWAPPAGDVSAGALAARDLGPRGAPTVVLLHGLTGSNRYWGAAFDALAADGRLIVPDLLGFGASPRPAHGYSAEGHADAVAACLAHRGVVGPVLVVGHSFGALVALRLASRHPALVGGVVAFAPPLYADRAAARRHVTGRGPLEALLAIDAPWSRAACEVVHARPATARRLFGAALPAMPAPLVDDSLAHSPASYFESLEQVLLAAKSDSWLAATRAPVRLVAGDADRLLDRRHLAGLAARWTRASLVEWHGAGHHLPLERPEACLEEVRHMGRALRQREAVRRRPS